jgi:tRNA pseudouridine32 synthase/23S rRNA pseudouridine746 synthase
MSSTPIQLIPRLVGQIIAPGRRTQRGAGARKEISAIATSLDNDIEILFADEAIVVANKPPGLLSVPGIGPANQDCLAARLQSGFPGARIVHRLDQHTSGVIVLARNADVHRHLSSQFESRCVEKRYVAVVAGLLEKEEGEINLPTRKDMTRKSRHIVDHAQGKQAITRWRVIERHADRTRLTLHPLTGRSHQLRVHLSAICHPILGDDLYAPPDVVAMATRLMLHAEHLAFTHPSTCAAISFEAPASF